MQQKEIRERRVYPAPGRREYLPILKTVNITRPPTWLSPSPARHGVGYVISQPARLSELSLGTQAGERFLPFDPTRIMSKLPEVPVNSQAAAGLALRWLPATGRYAGAEPPAIARQFRLRVYETLRTGGRRATCVGCC
jgi:hypothetical protein